MKQFVLSMLICLATCAVFAQEQTSMRVATYNLRFNNPEDSLDAWPNRKENVKALVRYHDFDIFGTQEGFIDQLKDLSEMQEYAYTGVGRDDGKEAGEHSSIFYKKERFKLLQSGDFWLSETPAVPSFGWDAKSHKRICSWGKFKERKSGKEFYFFSVHFDHRGVEARIESGKLMVQKIKEIAGKTPVISVGDFNSAPESEQIQTMKSLLKDSYEITRMPPYGPAGTTNSFRWDKPYGRRIDYIFVSDPFRVMKYATLTDSKDQRYPSDHLPIVADILF